MEVVILTKLRLKNFRVFGDFDMNFDDGANIIVGDNEAGKSTVLQAVDLALSGRHFGRSILESLNVHWINQQATKRYIESLAADNPCEPPEILIEAHFSPAPELQSMRGLNHSGKEDVPGVRLRIFLDPECAEEYQAFLTTAKVHPTVPVEYYTFEWKDFAGEPIPPHRRRPFRSVLIDARLIRLQAGTDYYLRDVISGALSPQERAKMALTYRQARQHVGTSPALQSLNELLEKNAASVTDKALQFAMDQSEQSGWEASLIPHLDGIPITQIGQGEQASLKLMLAMIQQAERTTVVLVEEPENNLSHSRLNILLARLAVQAEGQQMVIATHSSYVLNKMHINKLKLLRSGRCITLGNLSIETTAYFRKLSGYDTLRMICCRAAILVEGPSDELIVQKAYHSRFGRLPIEDGVDVIDVRTLAFKRFIELASHLDLRVAVVTDNDGKDPDQVRQRYQPTDSTNVRICVGSAEGGVTLENQMVASLGASKVARILGRREARDEAELIGHMKNNKTDVAIKIFDSEEPLDFPRYITEAIRFVNGS